MLTLSLRDRDRLSVLRQVDERLISARRGAELLGLSVRQLRRLRRRFEREGDRAVIHGLRGRPPNNLKPAELKARALERASEAVFADFGPTLLAEHLSRDAAIGPLRADTLRKWLIEVGRWKVRRRGQRHRKARPRREAFGELIQWDSSDHAWFEERYPGRFVLIKMVDDATNRLLMARFVPTDTGAANRQLVIDYLRRYGRPVAFYADQAGHFGQRSRSIGRIPKQEREAQLTRSIIRCALEAVNVKLILARSPQAKGRVERDFGTSQDRLVKELRVAGISSLEAGNRFLEEVYLPYWNERFPVQPVDPKDVHRRLPKTADLERLFAETLTRTVTPDFTIRYQNQRLQISKVQARGIRPGQQITVERRLDGSTRFRWKNRYLILEHVAQLPRPSPRNAPPKRTRAQNRTSTAPPTSTAPKPRPTPPRPGPDHPWRKNGTLWTNTRAAVAARRASTLNPTPP